MKKLSTYLLMPFSWLYGSAVAARNALYDLNVLKQFEFEVPLIVVGNLSAGGTGKTPHVEYLVEQFKEDLNIATLSRGYRRRSKGFILASEKSTAKEIGDEPMQYHYKYPEITVAVGEDRALAITEMLSEQADIDVIILDDAFQHRAVKAGLNILITDHQNLFTTDHLLPAGRLREYKSAAGRADIMIVSKCPPDLNEVSMQEIKQQILPFYKEPVFFTSLSYGSPYDLFDKKGEELRKDMEVIALTGIANPNNFHNYLKKKLKVVHTAAFPDHHYFTIKELEKVKQQYPHIKKGQLTIVTTEKDAMRLMLHKQWLQEQEIKIIVVPVKVYFLHNDDSFNFTISNFIKNFNSRE